MKVKTPLRPDILGYNFNSQQLFVFIIDSKIYKCLLLAFDKLLLYLTVWFIVVSFIVWLAAVSEES